VDFGTYEKVYKLACRESNTAPHPQRVHPDLVLVSHQEADIIPPSRYLTSQAHYTGAVPLPLNIIARVLRFALYFSGEVVHVLTRLDSQEEPPVQQRARQYSRLHRFHVGSSPVSLTHTAVEPNVLLAPLKASRFCHFIGCNIFYGMNTFAFSSLGEFGFFCNGIVRSPIPRVPCSVG